MLKVGLDLRATEPGFKSHFGRGTGRYATELTRLLPQLAAQRGTIEIRPLAGDTLRGTAFERKLIASLPAGRETVESQLCLPRRLRRAGVDVTHFFAHGDAPAWGGAPTLVTVLDLIPIKFRDLYRGENENWRYHLARFLELRAIRAARGIIAISEATKRDIVEILDIPEEKIAVTPLAVDSRFKPATVDQGRIRRKLGLPEDRSLALYVGGIDPRKNMDFLLEVFRGVVDNSPEGSAPFLVLAGKQETDKFYPRFRFMMEHLKLDPYLIKLGFFPDELLPELYQAVDLFFFPSLYEGFGLPVLEAISCGTAVAAGRNSSMPELVGDQYPLLPDNDLGAWVEMVSQLLGSSAARRDLATLGLRRRELFSWERTAEGTLDAYERFAGDLRRDPR